MRHTVVPVREFVPAGAEWLSLADARERGIPLDWVAGSIGPRERGMVYRSGYWNTVNTVHDVFVKVGTVDGAERAVWWSVVEESADDRGRARTHCTSWEYDTRNQVLASLV
ncbi:hypothetical protein SEA_SATIS_331 [Streptomyces phage Satis]|nr:hypothetical protein SEA_SATIS_331 [Streptomyces phage Satis]QBZ72217.1 hypothetical protein SEA_KRADAL_331 [Streptomyces phage Kradal]QPL14639.1 hypothetical protein SEA_EHYELIMAYOE_334 [Streptomyces phage EhyElimayoE]